MAIDILFADGRASGVHTARGLRTSRAIAWAIRTMGRSDAAHVAVAFRDEVIDPAVNGDRVFGIDRYVTHYPGLIGWATVPGSLPFPLRALARTYPGWRCTQTACRVLRLAGCPVPDFILPSSLERWLNQHGYPVEGIA